MRGRLENQVTMLISLTPDELVPQDHPIRRIKPIVDQALKEHVPDIQPDVRRGGSAVHSSRAPAQGLSPHRPLLHPQRAPVLRATAVRLLFKWFLDLNITDTAFDASTFSKNKERLLEHQVAHEFLSAVIKDRPPPASAVGGSFYRGRDSAGGLGFVQEL